MENYLNTTVMKYTSKRIDRLTFRAVGYRISVYCIPQCTWNLLPPLTSCIHILYISHSVLDYFHCLVMKTNTQQTILYQCQGCGLS